MALLFVMEIATGVVSFVYREQINTGVESGLTDLMNDYKDGSAAKSLMLTIEDGVSLKNLVCLRFVEKFTMLEKFLNVEISRKKLT